VGRFFKAQGYRYVHVGSWFPPTRTATSADETPPVTNSGAAFEAKLEETTFKPTLDDLMEVPDPPAHHLLHRNTLARQLDEFERVSREPGPKFVLLHVLLPHEPYVFDEVGDYPSNAERAARGEGDNYRRQKMYVDDHIKRIVDQLLEAPPAEQPVIAVVGDEGPWPVRYVAERMGFEWATATTAELETKFGILNAFFLPGQAPDGSPAPYPTISSWNTFPVVLGHTFGAAIPLLPDRTYASTVGQRLYDLVDVTDRLPSPYGTADPQAMA
jgi:hypothetical protein